MAARNISIQEQIVHVHQWLYRLRFSVGNDGNTSYRADRSSMWITPAGGNKSRLTSKQISLVNLRTGKAMKGIYEPSTEWRMHAEIYKSNPNIKAIVHAHPPYSIACSLVNISLEEIVLPEIAISLGPVKTLKYTCPGTEKIAKQVAQAIKDRKGVIMQRHGVVTIGDSLEEALTRLEIIEHAAKILLLAKSVGNFPALSKKEQAELSKQIKEVYRKE